MDRQRQYGDTPKVTHLANKDDLELGSRSTELDNIPALEVRPTHYTIADRMPHLNSVDIGEGCKSSIHMRTYDFMHRR
ncbi:hypothetical protein DH86_00004120 [Scytalidium sp. 3C]|nr:hypothetical protein DH86_00004120 [Scytalidium sp. 3C]